MKSKVRNRKAENARRGFLRSALVAGAGVAAVSVLGFIPVGRQWQVRLRPPGALNEAQFLAGCIKCGQCVQVCPVEAINLADIGDGLGIGLPKVDARDQACDFSCDGLQCVLACPTGALTHEVNYPHEIAMGIAKLVAPELCLARRGEGFRGIARGADYKGKLRYNEVDRWSPIEVREFEYDLELCDLCVRQCPIEIRNAQCEAGEPPSGDENQCPPKKAISLEAMEGGGFIPVVHDGCVGCGVCEMICPLQEPAIVVEVGEQQELSV